MVNFFHKFIPRFAERAAPLNALRKKGAQFFWGLSQQQAFEDLKLAIINPPVLGMADFSCRFILQTDASSLAVAAVLLQESEGERRPIAFASRTLTQQERKFSAYELECLAVLFGLDKFRGYVEHVEFDLETDNQALMWCLSHPRQLGRIARWVIRFSAFKFCIHHIRGTQNVIADALSRMYDPDTEAVVAPILLQFPMLFEDIATYQRADPHISAIINQLASEDLPGYSLKKGVLYCKARYDRLPKIVLPQALVPALFAYFHESPLGGHLGVRKTICKIRHSFIWKGMDNDIATRVKACMVCGLSKPARNTHYGMLSSEVASRPMEKLFIDFVGKFPRSKSGHAYALVCVDAFTKFVWIFPVREASTATTIRALNTIFASFGLPEVLVSDNASQFVAHTFRRMCFARGIRHVTTTPHYPQPSHAERFNRNLRAALIAYHHRDHTRWDENLTWLQFAFNSARHDAHKATPFSLMFSFTPNSPLSNLWAIKDLLPDNTDVGVIRERWDAARRNLSLAHRSLQKKYDRTRTPVPFRVGDSVWLRNFPVSKADQRLTAKLSPRYKGPYVIAQFTTPVSVRLTDSTTGGTVRAHVSQLKAV
jgi:transposase InsO family protein